MSALILAPAYLLLNKSTDTSVSQKGSKSVPTSGDSFRVLMTKANRMNSDETSQHVGPHVRSKLLGTQIIFISAVLWMVTMKFPNF